MKGKNQHIKIATLLLGTYYLIVAWLLYRSGYEHSERLFYAEKLKLLFEFKENTLLTLGTTFPTTVFLASVFFAPFGYLFAPIAASIVMMCLLFFFMANDLSKTDLPQNTIRTCLLLLFLFNLEFVFAAASGRNVAAIMLFFYLMFRSLFYYYKNQTTYYLSLASIYLTCLVFTEINFIWMLLSFFPFVVLISIEGIKVSKTELPVFQYYQALNNRSLRRKLANRTLSLYLVLFLLPLGAVYLFRTLNNAHAGDPTYFLTSQYANWRVTGSTSLTTVLDMAKGANIAKQTQIVFHFFAAILSPIFIFSLLLFRGKLYELFTIITPLIFYSIILIDTKIYLTVEYFVILTVMAIVALSFYATADRIKWFTSPLLYIVTALTIYCGYYYFSETNDVEEQQFFVAASNTKNWFQPRSQSELQRLAEYLNTIKSAERPVLIDDASAYGIVAYLPDLKGLVMPLQKNFVTVIENPTLTVQYMVVAKRNNRLHNFTVMNAYNLGIMKERLQIRPSRVFETENWIVYNIR
ncbi:MAG: hypothetical protein RL596_386 [Bacteroidota bacterium]|jgi:hypothetical protein